MIKSFRFFVYILRCSDNSYYTGVTNNVELCLKQHEEGVEATSYTYSRRPVELVFMNEFKYVNQAIAFEKQIKGWSRKKKEALINDNWNQLKELARCKNSSSHMNNKER